MPKSFINYLFHACLTAGELAATGQAQSILSDPSSDPPASAVDQKSISEETQEIRRAMQALQQRLDRLEARSKTETGNKTNSQPDNAPPVEKKVPAPAMKYGTP